MEKNEKQVTYETPEAETVELKMDTSFVATGGCAGGVHSEDSCITDTDCMEDFI